MAFQTGTQIRPELGRANVSGFARGGAAIGSGILQGIENYQQQKQITSSALADLEGRMAADPSLLETTSQAGGDIGKAFKSVFEEGNYKQGDVLKLSGFVNSLQSQNINEQQSQLRDAQIAAAKAQASATQQLQDTKAKNLNAMEKAIATNTSTDGSVDVSGLTSTYMQLGGRDKDDIALFSDMAEQAKTGKDPVLKTVTIDGFKVLLVNNKFMQARGAGDGVVTEPSQIKVMQDKTERYKKALELYKQGDMVGSQAELIAIGMKNFMNLPMTPEQAFPDVVTSNKPTVPDSLGILDTP